MENHDLISTIANILHEKPSRIEAKVDALDINTMIKLVDAVANEDIELIKSTLAMGMSEKTDGEDGLDDADDDIDINLDDDDDDDDDEDDKHIHERAFDVNIGDEVSVNGEDGIVKIAHGPNNTVGVLIDGEITMVHRGEIKPLKEHVLGMTNMPDLKRMQQLAGIMIDNIAPADMQSLSTEPQAPIEVIDVPSDGCDGNCDPKIAIDDAIEKIEQLLPQLRVGDYKDVTQRLQKAMNVIYESLNILFKPSRLRESSGERIAARLVLRRVMTILESTSKAASKCKGFCKKSAFARSLASLSEKVEKLSLDAKNDKEKTKGRKSVKDYLMELDVNTQEEETIGANRTDAIKTLQTRMGNQTTTQDAAKAYDKMRTTGKIKQSPTGMTMPAMGDDSLKNEVSAALGGGTNNSAIKK